MIRILSQLVGSKTTLLGLGSVTTGFIFMLVVLTQIELNLSIAIIIGVSWGFYLIFQFLTAYFTKDVKEKTPLYCLDPNAEEDEEKKKDEEPRLTWKEKHGVPYSFVKGKGQEEIVKKSIQDFNSTLAYNAKVDATMAKAGLKSNDAYSEAMNAYRR